MLVGRPYTLDNAENFYSKLHIRIIDQRVDTVELYRFDKWVSSEPYN